MKARSIRQAERAKVQTSGDRDPLTGLYNRQHFVTELDRLLSVEREWCDSSESSSDIDNFTRVNHSVGCALGDQYLKRVGLVLQEGVGAADLVARIGSDEFAVLLDGVDETHALEIAESLRVALVKRALGNLIRVSVGVVALSASKEFSAEAAVASAEVALNDAKAAGGGRTAPYRSGATTAFIARSRIRYAIANDRFVLYEQPILDLTRNVVGCHAALDPDARRGRPTDTAWGVHPGR